MDAIDHVLMNSRRHVPDVSARTAEPAMSLAVLTCMDARIEVAALLGLRPGDAHVIRNAGGRATPEAMRCLAVSQAVLGTREVLVMHHTECLMGGLTQSQLAERIRQATGHQFADELGAFSDPIRAVVDDVERLRAYPGLAHRDRIRGFIYDLAGNTLTEVPAR